MEEYYVSMKEVSECGNIGSIVKRYSTTNPIKYNTSSEFRPATLQEIEAYKSGIGNVKDMVINDLNIIEIW